MDIYLVGGAVRDKLLNYPSKDRDYVVVGSSADEMLRQGFEQVGKDFPVFLHPDTKAEYALARTERKIGGGYKGFEVFASPEVTLEEDLQRRDLTINAMAQRADVLIDPYGGKVDLEARILRHVSPHFTEDPLRILRVARFAARYAHLGFSVAPETMKLMQEMVNSGELALLTAERVWQEISRSLAEQSPDIFFEVLRQCGALAVILPELDVLFGVPQPAAKHHPEVDTGIHAMMVLRQATKLSDSAVVRFAALMHDLGKGLTKVDNWPPHYDHEAMGLKALKTMGARLRIPNEFVDLAEKVMKYHTHCHRAIELKAATLLKVLEALGAFRQPQKLTSFLLACEADARGRKSLENSDYPQADWIKQAYLAANEVDPKEFVKQGLVGKKIGDAIHKRRLEIIQQLKRARAD